MKRPAFTLLLDTRQAVAELMGECPKCGAMTTQVLKLAWQARVIACSELSAGMQKSPLVGIEFSPPII